MGIFRVIIKESGAGGTGKPPHEAHTGEEVFMLRISISNETAMWLINTHALITTWEIGATKPTYSIMWPTNKKIYFPYEKIEQW